MIVAGFGLTMRVFYPGLMTYDARYVYDAIAEGQVGDWQSPVMTVLWALVDPVAPRAASMFLLIATIYWLAFGVLAWHIARRSFWLAAALPLLAIAPPAFILVGVIWRDVLFASVWLLAAALTLTVADRSAPIRLPVQLISLALLALGVLLRPNALLAAPVLGAFILWPSRYEWKRAAIAYAPAVIAFYGLVQVVYYDVLGAMRQNPLHSVFVFDLGGITHFAKQNQFPVRWTPAETDLLTSRCYDPRQWDVYWTWEPCRFVMDRLEKQEKIFGTPALTDAWMRAVIDHSLDYVHHRSAFMWTFLTGNNVTVWMHNRDDPTNIALTDNPAFMTLKTIHDMLEPTPLFRTGLWLLLCAAVCAAAWGRRNTPAGAFAVATCGAAVIYVMTFSLVGVAADFRYGYWAVLAALTGAVVIASRLPSRGDVPGHASETRMLATVWQEGE